MKLSMNLFWMLAILFQVSALADPINLEGEWKLETRLQDYIPRLKLDGNKFILSRNELNAGKTVYAEGFKGTYSIDGSTITFHYEKSSCSLRRVDEIDVSFELSNVEVTKFTMGNSTYIGTSTNDSFEIVYGCRDGQNGFVGSPWVDVQTAQ